MTINNGFKKQVRARMETTGETYMHAYNALSQNSPSTDNPFLKVGFSPLITSRKISTITLDDICDSNELKALTAKLSSDDKGIILCAGKNYSGRSVNIQAVSNTYHKMKPHRLVASLGESFQEEGNERVRNHVDENDGVFRKFSQDDFLWNVSDDIQLDEMKDLTALNHGIFVRSEKHKVFATLQGKSFTHIIQNFSQLSHEGVKSLDALIMQERMNDGTTDMFLRSIIVMNADVRDAITKYLQDKNEATMTHSFSEIGIETLDMKKKRLFAEGYLNPAFNPILVQMPAS